METFKQVMGFVLLAVVILLLTFVEWARVVPTLAFLFACGRRVVDRPDADHGRVADACGLAAPPYSPR